MCCTPLADFNLQRPTPQIEGCKHNKPRWRPKGRNISMCIYLIFTFNSLLDSSNTFSHDPPWTNLRSRCDTEATVSTDLRFLLLCISHLGALLLCSFRPCRTDMIISTFSWIGTILSSCLTEHRLTQSHHSTATLTLRPSKVPKPLFKHCITLDTAKRTV